MAAPLAPRHGPALGRSLSVKVSGKEGQKEKHMQDEHKRGEEAWWTIGNPVDA